MTKDEVLFDDVEGDCDMLIAAIGRHGPTPRTESVHLRRAAQRLRYRRR